MIVVKLFELYYTEANKGDLLIDMAKGLASYALERNIHTLPITVPMVELSVGWDRRMSNALYERGFDALGDMVVTISHRLPVGEELEMSVDWNTVTIYHRKDSR